MERERFDTGWALLLAVSSNAQAELSVQLADCPSILAPSHHQVPGQGTDRITPSPGFVGEIEGIDIAANHP